LNVSGVGLEKDMLSDAINPLHEVNLNVKPPWSQLKSSGVKVPRANDPGCGQAAALAGVAPVTTKVPAVAKRAMPNLEWLRMIKKIYN
jgi:hypothetical protein